MQRQTKMSCNIFVYTLTDKELKPDLKEGTSIPLHRKYQLLRQRSPNHIFFLITGQYFLLFLREDILLNLGKKALTNKTTPLISLFYGYSDHFYSCLKDSFIILRYKNIFAFIGKNCLL